MRGFAGPGGTGWFTEGERRLREQIVAHLAARVEPQIPEWEAAGDSDLRGVLAGLARQGWLGMRLPAAAGGRGDPVWHHVVLAEALGTLSGDAIGVSVTVHNDMAAPMLADAGGPEAVERFLRPALAGECVLAHAVSEEQAGSDVAAVATTATPVTGGYQLSGTKRWVIAGRYADAFVILARLPETRGPFGHVLLVVAADAPGVAVTAAPPTLGLGAAGVAGTVTFTDVFVPDDHRLGGHGNGLVVQLRQFEQERILAACRVVAIAGRLLDRTRQRLAERTTFGAPVGSRGQIRARMARLVAQVEAVRQLAYTAVDRWDSGSDHRILSAAVKLRSSRLAQAVARECLHLYGAAGQLRSAEVNRAFRDTRLLPIATGSDEMMLTAIARLSGWSAT